MITMTKQDDRAEGVLLSTAAGDALGAPYEFQPARGPELEVAMVGGAGWEPGEWTDDTSMAIAIAEVATTGADLRDEAAQDAIVRRWRGWTRDAKDVGIQTRSDAHDGRTRRHLGREDPRRIGQTPSAHRPHRRQRLTNAHRPRRAGIPQ
jgi:ADP-ribosylglycohydrolase